jgi:hypothetical protein
MQTFNKGAAVGGFGLKNPGMYNKAGKIAVMSTRLYKFYAPRLPRGNRLLVKFPVEGITATEFAAASNRNRQRKKGPVVRRGRRS